MEMKRRNCAKRWLGLGGEKVRKENGMKKQKGFRGETQLEGPQFAK
jgi:hypothetical protein